MRRRLEIAVILLATVLQFAPPIFSQKLENDGLVLLGSVWSSKTVESCDKSVYEIQLRLLFRNDGDQPLILIDPRNFSEKLSSRKIEFLYKSLGDDASPPDEAEKVIAVRSIQVLPIRSNFANPIFNFADFLDKPEPPPLGTVIIQPGFGYEFFNTFTLEQKITLEGPKGNQKKVWEGYSDAMNRSGIPLSEIPALTVEFNITMPRFRNNPKLFYTLQKRWRPFGKFVLDDKSNFTVKSERIVNTSGSNLSAPCPANPKK